MLLKKIKWNCVAGEKQVNGLRSIPGPPPPPGGPGLAFYIIISHVVIITNGGPLFLPLEKCHRLAPGSWFFS